MRNTLKLLLLLPILAWSQTDTQNYIRTYIYKEPTATTDASKANASVTYFDGLGRPVQQIAGKMSGTGKDMITHIEYDNFGRQSKDYLPYEAATSDLSYVGTSGTAVVTFYNKSAFELTQNPYSEKFFEASPLSRLLKQGAPGTIWKGNIGDDNDHTVKFAYLANATSEVRQFRAVASGNSYEPAFFDDGYYAAGTLYKSITQDENKLSSITTNQAATIDKKLSTTEEFKDKEGKLILKRTYNMAGSRSGMPVTYQTLDTYYVYDQYGNLTYVIPPLANSPASQLDLLCYQYKYDARNRLVEKKLPGVASQYLVYDNQDRIVAQGPTYSPFGSVNNSEVGWLMTKYDIFGRVAYTGWRAAPTFSTAVRQTLQGQTFSIAIKTLTTNTIDNIQINYTSQADATNGIKLLTVNYYDNYSFPGAPITSTTVESQTIVTNPKGLLTGTYNRILTNPSETYGELSVQYYDYKSRVIRTRISNTQLGGYTETDNKLDFAGKILYSITKHKHTSSSSEQEIKTQSDFTYTAQDRLLSEMHTIGNGTPELMSSNTYNAIGQLTQKKTGATVSAPLQFVDYEYNIRGWLKYINNTSTLTSDARRPPFPPQDLFALNINYTNEISTGGGAVPLYNGNISETTWRTSSDNIMRRYSYKYDNLNRLTDAIYQIPSAAVPMRHSYDELVDYDVNGNITNLVRNGGVDDDSGGVEIDRLTYTYNGNRLDKIVDSSNSPQGFSDFTSSLNDFVYDGYGNLTSDNNKGMPTNGIIYNHLNLPISVTISLGLRASTGTISYIYNSAGTKVSKKLISTRYGATTITTTDYVNGFQYTNGILDFFPTSEGYVKNTVVSSTNNYNYVYHYKDHLGNIRLSYTKDSSGQIKIMEESHYYPFGLKHTGYSANQQMYSGGGPVLAQPNPVILVPVVNPGDATYKYKYQGQERQDELGLNWDSFKWRNYDYAIGRFMSIDPLADKYVYNSPYAFQENKMGLGGELEGLELLPLPWLAADAAKNPNGVGAHVGGIAIGAGNTLKSIYNSARHPSQLISGLANMATASAAYSSGLGGPGAYSNALQMDSMLGTNSAGTLSSQANMFNNLVNGDGLQRGESIGEIAAIITIGEGIGAVTGNIMKGPISNPIPDTMARVIPGDIQASTLGLPTDANVFVTAASDISGLNASQIANRLTIPQSSSGFQVIEFPTPTQGLSSPTHSSSPGFVGKGTTAGGAREFNIPNGPIPQNANIKIIN